MTKRGKLSSILWAIGYAPEKMGSFEEVIIAIAERAKLEGIRAYFVFPGIPIKILADSITAAGGRIEVFHARNRCDPVFIARFIIFLVKEKIDLVHSHFDLMNFSILLSRFFYRKPFFIWHQHHITGSKSRLARRIFFSFLGWQADKVIAISNAVKNDLVAKGLSENKVALVYNGFNVGKFEIDYRVEAEALKSEFKINSTDVVISCIAQGRPEKGQLFLLEACGRIKGKFPNIRLLLIGAKGHKYFSVLLEAARNAGVENKVTFTEMRNDVPPILFLTDIVAIPSLSEGLSYNALESMAAGKPIVASNVGGLPELIKDNETGLLVEPQDVEGLEKALLCLIFDPEKRVRLGGSAKEFVTKSGFDMTSMVDNVYSIYKRFL